MIDPYRDVIDTWLRIDPHLKASVIHERLAAEPYGFAGHYQRVKICVRERRPQIQAELDDGYSEDRRGFHARFSTTAGAQAQVDWGEEGTITTPVVMYPCTAFTWCCRIRRPSKGLDGQPIQDELPSWAMRSRTRWGGTLGPGRSRAGRRH